MLETTIMDKATQLSLTESTWPQFDAQLWPLPKKEIYYPHNGCDFKSGGYKNWRDD